jgi:hypothetical protein
MSKFYYKYQKYKHKYLYLKQGAGSKDEFDLFWKKESDIQEKFSLLAPNSTRLIELLDDFELRKLNFVAAYIIDNPSEVLSR